MSGGGGGEDFHTRDRAQLEPSDQLETQQTWVILQSGLAYFSTSILSLLLSSPLAFLRAAMMAIRLGSRSVLRLPRHGAYFLEACVLVRRLRQSGCQHLHAHFGTNPATVALLSRMLGGPSYSFTVHGPEEFDHPFEIGLPEKIAAAAFVLGVSSYGRSQLYRWTAPGQWQKIHVVHCGLGPAFLEANPTPVPDNRQFVCVGRLCEQKGQVLLVRAIKVLIAAGNACQLVFVGDGSLRPFLEAEIERLQLQDCVRLVGAQGEDRVREEILKARALVLPSFGEGLPVVLMEALSLYRPVVSTYVAGIPELVEPGICGWLIPAGSVDDLAKVLREVLQTPVERLSEMGKAGGRRVRERHQAIREANKLRQLFLSAGEHCSAPAPPTANSAALALQKNGVSSGTKA